MLNLFPTYILFLPFFLTVFLVNQTKEKVCLYVSFLSLNKSMNQTKPQTGAYVWIKFLLENGEQMDAQVNIIGLSYHVTRITVIKKKILDKPTNGMKQMI